MKKLISGLMFLIIPGIILAHGWGGMHGDGWFGSRFMHGGFFHILIWVFIIYLIVSLVKPLIGKKTESKKNSLQLLDERFVKGEITEEQYRAMKQVILK